MEIRKTETPSRELLLLADEVEGHNRRKHQIARDFQISQFHAYGSKVSS